MLMEGIYKQKRAGSVRTFLAPPVDAKSNAGAVDLSRFLVSVARARDAVGGTSALSVLLS